MPEPRSNEATKEFRKKLQEKMKEVGPDSVLAILFTSGQVNGGDAQFPDLRPLEPKPIKVSSVLDGYYLQLYRVNPTSVTPHPSEGETSLDAAL